MKAASPRAFIGIMTVLLGRVAAGLGWAEMGMGMGMGMDSSLGDGLGGVAVVPRATGTSTVSGANLQTFTGALGGAPADAITATGNTQNPFSVDGDTFADFASALSRSCSNQHNACANIANGKQGGESEGGVTTGECDAQEASCNKATQGSGEAASSTTSAQPTLFSQDANFLYICDV